MAVERFSIYAHEQHDEEPDEYARNDVELGSQIPFADLEAFYDSNPLYEVRFGVQYDSATKTFTIMDCDVIGETFVVSA